MEILFFIGRGLETDEIIDKLFDIELIKERPK